MTHLGTPRFWLLTTAALIFGSSMTASAKDYNMGTPTMVAAAPGFPSVPAEQIARDVTSEFNPRTGARELVAAPFDPFEEDPSLAGSLRLRSADGAVTVDGQPLRDGALVELDFYYNSPSNDSYGGRNYGDVAFVNGEVAPTVLRDTRIIECSTRVENVVYNHTSYYDRGLYSGMYRPYRHYAGHSGFGFGYGSSYYGPGYSHYGNRGYYGHHSDRRRSSSSRPSTHRRVLDAVRNRNSDDRQRDRSDTTPRADTRSDTSGSSRGNTRRLTDREIDYRLSRVQSYGVGRTRNEVIRNSRGVGPMRSGGGPEPVVIGITPDRSSSAPQSRSSQPQPSETRRVEPRRTETRRSEPRRSESRRSEPRRSQPTRSESRPARTRPTPQPRRSKAPTPSRRISGGSLKDKMNFFPNDGYGGRSVVSSRSVDCAREDKLRVFIPNERLDAARFDGLTLVALDAQGGETPIYLPPNYIEGFRMAATGRVRPQGLQTAPNVTPQPYVAPQMRRKIEAAPCPAGTTKQANGTCLQIGTVGYPAR